MPGIKEPKCPTHLDEFCQILVRDPNELHNFHWKKSEKQAINSECQIVEVSGNKVGVLFNVDPPKEDIFLEHNLNSLFQASGTLQLQISSWASV